MPEHQQPLFHEDLNHALDYLISALGGNKKVAVDLWPSMESAPDKAGRKLSDCLNDNHQQKLSPTELLWLLAEGRKQGIHSAMAFITGECGYADPQPIEPEDEAAELQRQFIAAQKEMSAALKRMERLSLPSVKAVS